MTTAGRTSNPKFIRKRNLLALQTLAPRGTEAQTGFSPCTQIVSSVLLKRLRALPANDGPFIIYRTPSKVAFEGIAPRTVPPLLVFAELMATGDSRARETAKEIREHYLKL
jgi:hypothetical protein